MPSREQEPLPDESPSLYIQAARFRDERKAGRAYLRAQEALYRSPESDLSAYRFLLNRVSHVTVLGVPPPKKLDSTSAILRPTGSMAVVIPPDAQVTRDGGPTTFRALVRPTTLRKSGASLKLDRVCPMKKWRKSSLDRTIRKILAAGEPTTLPAVVITALLERRAERIRLGSWVERHHRPGQPL
jgi:hypothetical protein